MDVPVSRCGNERKEGLMNVTPRATRHISTCLRSLSMIGLLVLGYIALSSAIIVTTSTGTAKATSYCGIWVPPYTDCAKTSGGSWVNGYFNENWAHAQYSLEGGSGIPVCEHTYIAGTGTTVSNHCEGANAYSFCDLYYYYKHGYELSAHAVNDFAFEELVWGHARVVKEAICT
jgi:hypothetical protein